jgi:hypothetical protein
VEEIAMRNTLRFLGLTSLVLVIVLMRIVDASALEPATKRYVVKYISGTTTGIILSPGSYRTAINIQNPNDFPVRFGKSFSVGLPGETSAGKTNFVNSNELAPDEAFEIDCQDILDEVKGFCTEPLCKGFATLRTAAPLEVVAVYTSADPGGSVQSIHTERVGYSNNCPERTVELDTTPILFVPPHVSGNSDNSGHGPCVRFRLDLRTQDEGKVLVASYFMQAWECDLSFSPQHDFTAAEGQRETVLFSAKPQSKIVAYNVGSSFEHFYRDTNDTPDCNLAVLPPSPVESFCFVGDTPGNEAGTETRVNLTLREMKLEVEECGLANAE